LFDPALGTKPQVVVVNKADLPDVKDRWAEVSKKLRQRGKVAREDLFLISAVTGEGVRDVLYRALQRLQETPPLEEIESLPIYRMESDPNQFTIDRVNDEWHVRGEAIERAAKMTYWELPASIRRFQKILHALGIEDALRKAGVQEGDTVFIGDFELEWSD